MPIENNKFFFLSGAFSFLLFALLLVIITWQINKTPVSHDFAMVQSDIISVSLDMSEKKVSKPVTNESSVSSSEPIIPTQPKPIETKKEPTKVQPKITDLFSSVKTTAPSPNKESPQEERLNALEQKVVSTKRDSQLYEKAKSVDLAKYVVKMAIQGSSSGPNVDKYMAKIQGLVQAYFHPPTGSAGESAVILLRIDSMGKMINFKILRSSKNELFNGEVNWLKDRLNSIRFPESPDGNEGVLTCTLTTKE
jgi:periplasmic protein TonB